MIAGRIRHILFPNDLSAEDARGLSAVLDLALREESRVTILHVVEMLRDIPFDELDNFYRNLERQAQQKMAGLQEQFAAAGVPSECRVIFGERVREIVEFARLSGADLVVVRGRDVGEDGATVVNRVGYRVAFLSTSSVLLLNDPGAV
jgi:nucleotide-binding universal stress UspA family protein